LPRTLTIPIWDTNRKYSSIHIAPYNTTGYRAAASVGSVPRGGLFLPVCSMLFGVPAPQNLQGRHTECVCVFVLWVPSCVCVCVCVCVRVCLCTCSTWHSNTDFNVFMASVYLAYADSMGLSWHHSMFTKDLYAWIAQGSTGAEGDLSNIPYWNPRNISQTILA
jgi:hypothetical protein